MQTVSVIVSPFVKLVETSVDDDSAGRGRERGFVELEVVTISLQRVIN